MKNENIYILLIEDNPDHAELIIDALEEYHIQNEIIWEDSGEGGLDFLFRRGKYKDDSRSLHTILVLLDIKLPGIDGIEVLKTIKENPETTDIPVVMLTAYGSTEARAEAEKLGCYLFIDKPFEPAELVSIVGRVLAAADEERRLEGQA